MYGTVSLENSKGVSTLYNANVTNFYVFPQKKNDKLQLRWMGQVTYF